MTNHLENIKKILNTDIGQFEIVDMKIEDLKVLIEELEHYRLTNESQVTYREMVEFYEETQGKLQKQIEILTEQLDRRNYT